MRNISACAGLIAVLYGCIGTMASEPIRAINLQVKGLAYDRGTRTLFGGGTNRLLQIDPISGDVLRSFDMGRAIMRVAAGAGGSVWVGMNGAVRRFDTGALAADDPITIPGDIYDLAPSPSDPYMAAVSTPTIVGRYATAHIAKNGALLPDVHIFEAIGLNGSFIFGHVPNGFGHGNASRLGITPNGITAQGATGLPIAYYGFFRSLGDYVYHSSGVKFHATTLGDVGAASPLQYDGVTLHAVNADENAIYYLRAGGPDLVLHRHSHPSFDRTGYFRIGGIETTLDPLLHNLAAWSSNRLAFNGSSNLYLLHTDTFFLPADIEVTETVAQQTVPFGTNVSFEITVTNKGPGYALELYLTNSPGGGIHLTLGEPFPPGAVFETTVSVFPSKLGDLTHVATVYPANDTNAANNSAFASVTVVRPTGRITRIGAPASDIAYDSATGRLFLAGNGAAQSLDPEGLEFLPLPLAQPGERIETAGDRGRLAIYSAGNLQMFDTRSGDRLSGSGGLGRTLIDLAISPADPSIAAVSDETGTYLTRAGVALPDRIAAQGQVEFSEDGSKLYFVNASSCALQVYSVTANGLSTPSEAKPVNCSGFAVADGLVYFNNGLIHDPVSGERVTNSLSLSPPSFVVVRGGGEFDVVNRVGGFFTVRRFKGSELLGSIPLLDLEAVPVEVTSAGANRIALRTASPGQNIILVDVSNPDLIDLRIATANGSLAVNFATKLARTYRLERKTSVPEAWTTVQDNIVGTGDRVEIQITNTADTAAFYRVAILP